MNRATLDWLKGTMPFRAHLMFAHDRQVLAPVDRMGGRRHLDDRLIALTMFEELDSIVVTRKYADHAGGPAYVSRLRLDYVKATKARFALAFLRECEIAVDELEAGGVWLGQSAPQPLPTPQLSAYSRERREHARERSADPACAYALTVVRARRTGLEPLARRMLWGIQSAQIDREIDSLSRDARQRSSMWGSVTAFAAACLTADQPPRIFAGRVYRDGLPWKQASLNIGRKPLTVWETGHFLAVEAS